MPGKYNAYSPIGHYVANLIRSVTSTFTTGNETCPDSGLYQRNHLLTVKKRRRIIYATLLIMLYN